MSNGNGNGHGWIKTHRQIREHWLWNDKPFSKGQAWIDLLLQANHAPADVLFRDEIIHVEAGQFITSELKLSEQWGWSRDKVSRFFLALKSQEMAYIKQDKRKTIITICNWATYQRQLTPDPTTDTTSDQQQATIRPPSDKQQAAINKNVKNIKNEKNEESNGMGKCGDADASPPPALSFIPPTVEEVLSYAIQLKHPDFNAVYFCERHTKERWLDNSGKPIRSWRAAVRGLCSGEYIPIDLSSIKKYLLENNLFWTNTEQSKHLNMEHLLEYCTKKGWKTHAFSNRSINWISLARAEHTRYVKKNSQM
jgi:hypothetical protein